MRIPDFSIPSTDCFLTVDKNGMKINEGDILTSFNHQLKGTEKVKKEYHVTKYEDNLVAIVKPSHLLSWYVETFCEVVR